MHRLPPTFIRKDFREEREIRVHILLSFSMFAIYIYTYIEVLSCYLDFKNMCIRISLFFVDSKRDGRSFGRKLFVLGCPCECLFTVYHLLPNYLLLLLLLLLLVLFIIYLFFVASIAHPIYSLLHTHLCLLNYYIIVSPFLPISNGSCSRGAWASSKKCCPRVTRKQLENKINNQQINIH
jgi:hypothetical protein